jgi:hypothetical protein
MSLDEEAQGDPGRPNSSIFENDSRARLAHGHGAAPNPGGRVGGGSNRFELLQDAMVTRQVDTNELVSEAFDNDVDHAVFDFERLPKLLDAPSHETTRSLFPQPVDDEELSPPLEDRHWLDLNRDDTRSETAARPAVPPLITRLRQTEPADVIASETLPGAITGHRAEYDGQGAAPFVQASVTLLDLEVGELASDELLVSDPDLSVKLSEPYLEIEVVTDSALGRAPHSDSAYRAAWRQVRRTPHTAEPAVLPPQPEASITEAEPFAIPGPAARVSPAAAHRELPPPAAPTHFGTARREALTSSRRRPPRWGRRLKALGYVLLAAAAGAGLGFIAGL